MLKTAFGEQAIDRSQTFQWFFRFKTGRNSADDERSGRPVSSSTPEIGGALSVIGLSSSAAHVTIATVP